MFTKEQAIAAHYRQEIYHESGKRMHVNGTCQVWKRSPERFKLPVKFGLFQCLYITESNAHEFSITPFNK